MILTVKDKFIDFLSECYLSQEQEDVLMVLYDKIIEDGEKLKRLNEYIDRCIQKDLYEYEHVKDELEAIIENKVQMKKVNVSQDDFDEYITAISKREKKDNWFTRLFSSSKPKTNKGPRHFYEYDLEDENIELLENRKPRGLKKFFNKLFNKEEKVESQNKIIEENKVKQEQIDNDLYNKKKNYIDRYVKLYDFDKNSEIADFISLINMREDNRRITDELFEYVKTNIKNDNEEEFLNKLYDVLQIERKTKKEEQPVVEPVSPKVGAFNRIQNMNEEDEEEITTTEEEKITIPKEVKTIKEEEIKALPEEEIKVIEEKEIKAIEKHDEIITEDHMDALSKEEIQYIYENYESKDLRQQVQNYKNKLNELKDKLIDKKLELSVADEEDKAKLNEKIADIEGKISKAERKIKAYKLKTYYFDKECVRVAEETEKARLEEIEKYNEELNQKKIKEAKEAKEKADKEYVDFWNTAENKDLSSLQQYSDEEIKELYKQAKENSLMGRAAKEMIKKINADQEKKEAARLKVTVKMLREIKELNKQDLTKAGVKQVIATYALSHEASGAMWDRYYSTNHKEEKKKMI